jgi:hypothetical protein
MDVGIIGKMGLEMTGIPIKCGYRGALSPEPSLEGGKKEDLTDEVSVISPSLPKKKLRL